MAPVVRALYVAIEVAFARLERLWLMMFLHPLFVGQGDETGSLMLMRSHFVRRTWHFAGGSFTCTALPLGTVVVVDVAQLGFLLASVCIVPVIASSCSRREVPNSMSMGRRLAWVQLMLHSS